jgi:hypothetical protein
VSVRPTTFVFKLEPAFTPSTIVELCGGNLIVSLKSHDGELVAGSRFQATPDASHWNAFWNALEFLDIWSWKPKYDTLELGVAVCDGQGWQLQVQHAGLSVVSSGVNAYPSFGSPGCASLDEGRFGMFLFALGELLSHKWDLTTRCR